MLNIIRPRPHARVWTMWILFCCLIGLAVVPAGVQGAPPLTSTEFTQIAPQGFGDRNNNWAWSMQWWKGHLYVGTNYQWRCGEALLQHRALPDLLPYPPDDPDVVCPTNPENLSLQAEIWRWTPPNKWKRVYKSPRDVPLSSNPDKFVARDTGYRGMTIFTEPDGTEALYVAGVGSRYVGTTALPRILRSTDGENFAPLPSEPGTVLGDLPDNGFRNPFTWNGRFYIMAGPIQGSGVLLEAENPVGGNNNFREVTPRSLTLSSAMVFNDQLYLGTRDLGKGYSIIRTDGTGTPFFNYTTVVPPGANVTDMPNVETLSMAVFKNHLYVGGNGVAIGVLGSAKPAEVIRVNTDDSWDVIVGEPRDTPSGRKLPLSGLGAGFGYFFNQHIWRMAVFDNNLYIGTMDASTVRKDDPQLGPLLRPYMGFDLYRTVNGTDFVPVTINGFGDPAGTFEERFSLGVRSLEVTPYGLVVGSANNWHGTQIWLGKPEGFFGYQQYLPLVMSSQQ